MTSKQHRMIAQGLWFYVAKELYKIPIGSPQRQGANAGGEGKNCVFRLIGKSPAQAPYCRKFVSIHHGGLRPQWCTGGTIPAVIMNFGGSRSLLITAMVLLTPTSLVVWKSVNDTHGSLQHYMCVKLSFACSLCDS